jgi:alpha-tubulin suppressor-like RCC1 family protein
VISDSKRKRILVRSIYASITVLASSGSFLLACTDDEAPARPPFNDDASPEAALPDAGEPTDGSVVDARGVFDPKDEPVVCDASPCFTQIVAGEHHFCALASSGTVRCWGAGQKGQLGRDAVDPEVDLEVDAGIAKPEIEDLSGVTQISAAGATTCARLDDGGVSCWGANEAGQLGRETEPPTDEDPHAVPEHVAIEAAVRVDVGPRSVCAITAAGSAICWGSDESAQLARGEPAGVGLPPAPADLGASVKRTAAGADTGFALTNDGRLLTWGAVAGPSGSVAGRISSVTPTPLASPVQGITNVSSFAVSGLTDGIRPPDALPWSPPPAPNQHACAVVNGDVYCWGKTERGALGSGLPDSVLPLPTFARLGTRAYAQQIAAGGENTCVRLTDGTVTCTGENERGQLGTGKEGPFSGTFVAALTLQGRAVEVAVARETVCTLLQGGTIACWGGNTKGELGLGNADDEPHPSAEKVAF